MPDKKRPLVIQILKFLWLFIKGIFLLYAVVFSLAGTILIFVAYHYVTEPIHQVLALKYHNPPQTAYMAACQKELDSAGHKDSLIQTFIPIDSISPYLKNDVIAAEDDGFYTHPGFDIEATLAALEYNRVHGNLKRGASTITQQLAKNLFLTNDKNFDRKFKEMAYTLLLERYLGKERILELYLNYAQWGKNIFGCEAALRQYYKKSSKNLSRYESAVMAAVLAMPTKISPLAINSVFIGKRIAVIANNLYLHGSIDDSGYSNLTGMPAPVKDFLSPGSKGPGMDTADQPLDH